MGKKGGALVFKGDKPKKKKKKSKTKLSSSSKNNAQTTDDDGGSTTASVAAGIYVNDSITKKPQPSSQPSAPSLEQGIGKITTYVQYNISVRCILSLFTIQSKRTTSFHLLSSLFYREQTRSGTVVTGHDTKFQTKDKLRPGDALLVHDEMRVLTMVLSDRSISLSTPLTQSVITPTPYTYIKKPRNTHNEHATTVQEQHNLQLAQEQNAVGTAAYGNADGTEFVYREVTENGSYRIRREQLQHDVGRTDLCYMRTKKKADKYC